MPGVDFRAVRDMITMFDVLALIGCELPVGTADVFPWTMSSPSIEVNQEPLFCSEPETKDVSLFCLRLGWQSSRSVCSRHTEKLL